MTHSDGMPKIPGVRYEFTSFCSNISSAETDVNTAMESMIIEYSKI